MRIHCNTYSGFVKLAVNRCPIEGPDPSTSVIRVITRIKPGFEGEDVANKIPSRDHLWMYDSEAHELLKTSAEIGQTFPMPRAFVSRLLRFHLVDSIGGRSWGAGNNFEGSGEVKTAQFKARVTAKDDSSVSYTFTGLYSMLKSDGSIAHEGRIDGEFQLGKDDEKLVLFRAYASGMFRGGGVAGHTAMPPPGKSPLVFALVEADDYLGRNVPPAWAHGGHAVDYHQTMAEDLPGSQ